MNRTIKFMVLLIFVSSCVSEIETDAPAVNPQIVVNSLINPDSTFSVILSYNMSLNGSGITTIDNAQVSLWVNETFYENLQSAGNGYYTSNFHPATETGYSIKITTADDEIISSTFIPAPPAFVILNKEDSAFIDSDGEYQNRCTIKIVDNNTERNYYEVVFKVIESNPYNGNINTFFPYINSSHQVIQNEGIFDYRESMTFSDSLFNGSSVEIPFCYHTFFSISSENNFYQPYKLVVIVNSTSKEYYQYKKSLWNQMNDDNGIWSGQPTNIYSNISGGLGIFAGYCSIESDTIF